MVRGTRAGAAPDRVSDEIFCVRSGTSTGNTYSFDISGMKEFSVNKNKASRAAPPPVHTALAVQREARKRPV